MGNVNPAVSALVWPMLAQVVLAFAVMLVMGYRRRRALYSREVRLKDIALSGEAWPTGARQAANNFSNQFEVPVLFYALVLAAIVTGATGWLTVTLAWAFVASRFAHSFVHVTSNDLRLRAAVFFVGCIILMVLTGRIAVALL
ncbi:MAPEG family protein [Phreatobacter sp.]|uniref:MAPEG family protein n=1 Tax=Phreatobacter sp. TaxID=1966341 RepID=UPI003F6E5E74